ncbi:MAG TPA: hypothetical protein VF677_12755 [Flavobacterium sp.]|jgi:hypothetical protein
MKKKLLILSFILVTVCQLAHSQTIIGIPKTNSVTVKKIAGSDLVIPIEIGFFNNGTAVATPTVSININNTNMNFINQFSAADLENIRILNNNQTLSINQGVTANATNIFYLFIDRNVIVNCDKIINLNINEGTNILSTIKITIQPEDVVISLDGYLEKDKKPKDKINKLDYVTKVESTTSNNILVIYGYKTNDCSKQDVFSKRSVELKKGKVFTITEWSAALKWNWRNHWIPVPISLITVPFKIRPSVNFNENNYSTSATSGLSNIGFNLDLGKVQMDRYFTTGKKSTHKFSIGFLASPSIEELDATNTNNFANYTTGTKSKQLFISTGLTVSYSYNDISFVFVPAGWDISTSTLGKEWMYGGERWWGFGIAISPKFFSTVLNK